MTKSGRKLHLADRTPEVIEAINEAERLAEGFEDRVSCANLHRLRGVFLATMGADEAQIEASFCAALSIAREQRSISLVKSLPASMIAGRKGLRRRERASATAFRPFFVTVEIAQQIAGHKSSSTTRIYDLSHTG